MKILSLHRSVAFLVWLVHIFPILSQALTNPYSAFDARRFPDSLQVDLGYGRYEGRLDAARQVNSWLG